MSRLALLLAVAPALLATPERADAPPEKVALTIQTLHAAALTSARAPGDSTDAPFFLVTVTGRNRGSTTILPDSAPVTLRQDGAVGARPLEVLSLAEGDSVQVLVSVLESGRGRTGMAPAAEPSSTGASESATDRVARATSPVAPMVRDGAHWIGSASLLVTNEGGAIYWRRLECVASCKVLTAPATAVALTSARPSAGVLELDGAGGTYHLALRANRMP